MARILLFHLSDLHFGSCFVGTQTSLAGLAGHDVDICRRLAVDLRLAQLSDFQTNGDDTVEYLISGDLTRVGSTHDFHLSHTYILADLEWVENRAKAQQSASLGLPHDRVHAIPGNHDHWCGISPLVKLNIPFRRPPAYNAAVFPDLLEPTPWRHTLWSKNKGFAIELFGVDSSEGLKSRATNFRARGELSQVELHGQFDAAGHLVRPGLEQLLQEAARDARRDGKARVRAVACHHAFSNQGGLADAWPLSNGSRTKLLTLARQYDVRCVLTGHTHYFYDLRHSQSGWPSVWELRCGSTTQQGTQPHPPGFWVHEIIGPASGGSAAPQWRAWKFQWNGTQFAKNPTHVNVH